MKKKGVISMKTVTITKNGQILIPKEVRKVKRLRVGTKLVVLVKKDHIELIPFNEYREKISSALMSEKALREDWLSPEDEEAWKDL